MRQWGELECLQGLLIRFLAPPSLRLSKIKEKQVRLRVSCPGSLLHSASERILFTIQHNRAERVERPSKASGVERAVTKKSRGHPRVIGAQLWLSSAANIHNTCRLLIRPRETVLQHIFSQSVSRSLKEHDQFAPFTPFSYLTLHCICTSHSHTIDTLHPQFSSLLPFRSDWVAQVS